MRTCGLISFFICAFYQHPTTGSLSNAVEESHGTTRAKKSEEMIQFPEMTYRFTSFATYEPHAAAEFCVKYFGGTNIDPDEFLTHRNATSSDGTVIRGLRWFNNNGSKSHDVYFISDPNKPSGPRSIEDYERYLHNLHRFDVQETWDWFQDWHFCFYVDNLDLVLDRLLRDGVPIVTRSDYSFYVEIPFGITFQFLGPSMETVWTENFLFCRRTTGIPPSLPQPLQIKALPQTPPDLPELSPSHHSFFSNDARTAFNFTLTHTSAEAYNMSGVWQSTHMYGDGRCAWLQWMQFSDGFQIHFVEQYYKREGNWTIRDQEAYVSNLPNRQQMSSPDAYMDFRIGFSVGNLSAVEEILSASGVPFIGAKEDCHGLLYLLPGGTTVEVLE